MSKKSKRKKIKRKENVKKSDFDLKNVLYFSCIIIATYLFFKNFTNMSDITNNYIKLNATWIISLQIIIYILLIGIFVYFGYNFLNKRKNKKFDRILIISGFILVILVQVLAFNPALDRGGDNARYICGAISLAKTGEYKDIEHPNEHYKTTDQPGVSIMLAPLVKIFGVNIPLFKFVPFLLTIGSLILFFILLENFIAKEIAIILTLILGTQPYISTFSSMIMTEIPFIFFSLLSFWLLLKYEKSEKINYIMGILCALSILMTYFSRTMGIGFSISSVLYFVLKKDWKKAFFLGVLVFILFGGWQLRNKLVGGTSQLSAITGANGLGAEGITILVGKGIKNLLTSLNLIPQVLFADASVRWKINPFGVKELIILSLVFIGYVSNLIKKRSQLDLFFIIALASLCIGTPDSNLLPMVRYLCVFVPFFILYFYLGINFIFSFWKKAKEYTNIVSLVLLLLLVFSNFSGTAFKIQQAHTGQLYSKSMENYFNAGKWIKDNTPEDVVVACRKCNTFYLFSERKAYRFASYWSKYNKEYEEERMKYFEKYNVSYLVIDTFSNSVHTAYKIIQNNKDKFELVKIIGNQKKGACYIFKVNKWW